MPRCGMARSRRRSGHGCDRASIPSLPIELGNLTLSPSHPRRTRLIAAHERFLEDRSSVRFAAGVRRFYSNGTLAAILSRGDVPNRYAAAVALGVVGNSASLDPLGRAISDADRGVRRVADESFRGLLIRSAEPKHRNRLVQVTRLNEQGEHAAALAPALILADQAPEYAEVYHQLAICWYGLDQFDAATEAYHNCVVHCRYHYPAWLGMARCRIVVGDLNSAIRSLRRAVEIAPDLEAARVEIRALERKAQQDSAD